MQRSGPGGRAATQSTMMFPAMRQENRFDAPAMKSAPDDIPQ